MTRPSSWEKSYLFLFYWPAGGQDKTILDGLKLACFDSILSRHGFPSLTIDFFFRFYFDRTKSRSVDQSLAAAFDVDVIGGLSRLAGSALGSSTGKSFLFIFCLPHSPWEWTLEKKNKTFDRPGTRPAVRDRLTSNGCCRVLFLSCSHLYDSLLVNLVARPIQVDSLSS